DFRALRRPAQDGAGQSRCVHGDDLRIASRGAGEITAMDDFRNRLATFLAIVVCGFTASAPVSAQSAPYVPKRFSSVEVDRMTDLLELDDQQSVIVRMIHQDYLNNWQASFGAALQEYSDVRTEAVNGA